MRRSKYGDDFDQEYRKPEPKPAPEPKQTLTEWITDVCKCKETTKPYPVGSEIFTGCVDGLVSAEVNGYSTIFACPACDRGKKVIPSAKKWPGSNVCYTQADMEKIYEDRREVAERMRRGSSRTPDLDMSRVGGGE